MGLADTTSHVVWVIAVLSVMGAVLATGFQQAELVASATETVERDRAARLLARIEGATFCQGGDWELRLTARYDGPAALDLAAASLVVDGTLYAAPTDTTALWTPGEERTFRRPLAAEVDRVAFVAPWGEMVFAEKRSCPELASIVVTPASSTIDIGETATFTATGFDQFGDPFPGEPYSWSSPAGAMVAVDPVTGELTGGTTAGTFLVMATSGLVSGTASVTILPGAPASIDVAPAAPSVTAGETQAFTTTIYDAYGNVNDTASVTWSTSEGTITPGGVLTAPTLAQSGVIVTATSGAASGTATVEVVPGPVDSISVSPSAPTVLTSRTQTFTATAYDQYDNVVPDVTFTWSATRGSITQGGLYTAPSTVGADTVTASAEGRSGDASVSVTKDVHVDAIRTFKNGVEANVFRKRDTFETRITVRDHDDALLQGVTVTVELRRPNGNLETTLVGVTGADGVVSLTYDLPANVPTGTTWVDRVTNLSGTSLAYASGSNVVTQVNFTVNP